MHACRGRLPLMPPISPTGAARAHRRGWCPLCGRSGALCAGASTILLLAAFGVADAQLMEYAAWPMRGRSAMHSGTGLIAAPDNSVAVFKYQTGNAIDSSPAVGPDGTVYVGSDDHYLYAVNADGSPKWKYQTGDAIKSSPAVGPDGTVYVGSDDTYLHAVHADGSLKWT